MGTVVMAESVESSASLEEREHVEGKAASCCSSAAEAACCDPSEKASCCGEIASAGCGCQ